MLKLEWYDLVRRLAAIAVCVAAVAMDAHAVSGRDRGTAWCEYGIARALEQEYASAETAFVAMLSESLGDARAWNNLGNLRAIQGQYDEALALYGRALREDTTEAGVTLNRALVASLAEREEVAGAEYRRGVAMAGGSTAAEALLGLRPEGSGKAFDFSAAFLIAAPGKKRVVSSREIRARLAESDTSRVGTAHGPVASKPASKPRSEAKSAPAGESSPALLFYWKR